MSGLSDITRRRVAKWMNTAKNLDEQPEWTEVRQAIDIGGHTYIVNNGQIYQCAHCGHFDPEWNATEVITYFKETFGAQPYEIRVVCSVAKEK
jgi:hypothetical protein